MARRGMLLLDKLLLSSHLEQQIQDRHKGFQDVQAELWIYEFEVEGDVRACCDDIVKHFALVNLRHLEQVDDAQNNPFVQ